LAREPRLTPSPSSWGPKIWGEPRSSRQEGLFFKKRPPHFSKRHLSSGGGGEGEGNTRTNLSVLPLERGGRSLLKKRPEKKEGRTKRKKKMSGVAFKVQLQYSLKEPVKMGKTCTQPELSLAAKVSQEKKKTAPPSKGRGKNAVQLKGHHHTDFAGEGTGSCKVRGKTFSV